MLISILVITFIWAICGLLAIWLFRQPPEKADRIYEKFIRRHWGKRASSSSGDASSELMMMNLIMGIYVIGNTLTGIALIIISFVILDGFADGPGTALIIAGSGIVALDLLPGSALWWIAVTAIKRKQRRLELEGP